MDRFTKEKIANNQTDDLEKLRVFCQLIQSANKVNEVSDGFGKLLAWLENDNGIKSLDGGQFVEIEEERKILLVTLKLAIENNIRNETTMKESRVAGNSFISMLSIGFAISTFAENLVKNSEHVKKSLIHLKKLLKGKLIRKENQEEAVLTIQEIIDNNPTTSQIAYDLNDYLLKVASCSLNEEALYKRLEQGWEKNQSELTKRYQKMLIFNEDSSLKLEEIEKQITKSEVDNKMFRKTIDETSDRISSLIQQLKKKSSESDFLHTQMSIVDSTAAEMLKCKNYTDSYLHDQEHALQQKQKNFIDLLKTIDDKLESNFNHQQNLLSKNQNFHKAIEELNCCYSEFKDNEKQILKTYNITGSLDLEIISEHFDSPYNPKSEGSREDSKEFLEDKNESLTIENEDLKEQNAKLKKETEALRKKLKDSNTLESSTESKIKEGARYEEDIRIFSEEINELKKEIQNLQSRNEHLKEKNKNLSTLNKKVKTIYNENRELLVVNDALQNEVDSLNEKLNQMDKNIVSCEELKKLQHKNEELHEKIKIANDKYLELKLSKSPRVIHIDCSTSSVLKTSSNEKKEEDSFKEEDSLKKELLKSVQNEKERNDILHNSLKRSQDTFKKIADIYSKLSLNKLTPNESYTLNIHHDDDNMSFSIKNISFSFPEISLLKHRENSSSDASNEEENVIEDLSSMLFQSYKKIDYFKMKFKAIKRKHEEETAKYTEMHTSYVVLADCLKELHLQRCDENESYVLKLKKGKDFSSIVLNGTRLMILKKIFTSIENSVAVKKSLEENCPEASDDELIKSVLNKKNEQEAADHPQDVQQLLRVLQRENQDLVYSIKILKKECLHFKKKKLEFEKEQNNSELTKNNPLFHYEEEDCNKVVSLKEAFNLSEANCVFLDKKNLTLEKQLQELQSVFEQLRCDRYDVLEQNECLVNEVREKNEEVNNEKQTNADLKREIEYLEKELEYFKFHQTEKVRCDQEEKSYGKIHTETEKLSDRYKLDVELLLREKKALLQEIDSMRASLHYIQIEKRFLQEQNQELNQQALREVSKSNECKKSVETPIESNVFLEEHHEDITRVVGLVVRFKKLQKYSEKLKNHLTKTKDELAEIKSQFRAAQVQLEALNTSNETLQKKYNDLEDVHRQCKPAITQKQSLHDIEERIRCFESKCYGSEMLKDYEVIKEEVNALACENEEIRQSCSALIKRNSFLRKESFASENRENQIQILTQRLNSLENENTVLKLQASKTPKNVRKIAFSRKISEHLCLLDFQDRSLKDQSLKDQSLKDQSLKEILDPHVSVKYTQTESNGSSSDYGRLLSIQCEELKNVVEELTKRNTVIRTKLSKQEKESEELKVLNNELRVKINNLVNSKVKENGTCSDCNHNNSCNGTHQSFFLRKEILSEYEKTELEEINKNFKYENKVLKEDLEKAEKMQRELKKEIQVLIGKKDEQERANNELLLTLEEIKGVEFVDSLSRKLNIKAANRNTKNNKNADELTIKNHDTLVSRPQNKDSSELESKYFEATKKNKEYECTIEILERQVLQLSRSILSEGSSEKQDTLKDLKTLTDLQSNSGENIEKSNEGDNSCVNNDKTWSAGDVFDLPDDKLIEFEEGYDNYQSCIKDGELVSVVEDLFKKYAQDNSAFNSSLLLSENKDDMNYEDNDEATTSLIVKKSEVETAVKVGKTQTFRAKEYLEKTLDLREEQLEKCRITIEALNDRIRENINEIDHLKQDNEKMCAMFCHAQDSISLLNKKIADSEVIKTSTEKATNTTEKKMPESHKTLLLNNQTLEKKLDFALQKETTLLLKVDELQKELGIQKNLTLELKRKLREAYNHHQKDLRFGLKPVKVGTCASNQIESHLDGKLKTGKTGKTEADKTRNKLDISSDSAQALSEVSDVESNSEEVSSPDYVSKLKTKLKLAREKIREKNKLIRSQNNEIDLLLDDLAIKNELIEQLRKELASAESAYFFKGILEIETPSFQTETSTLMAVKRDDDNCSIAAEQLVNSKFEENESKDFFFEEDRKFTTLTKAVEKKIDLLNRVIESHDNVPPKSALTNVSMNDEHITSSYSATRKVEHKDIDYLRRYSLAMKQSFFEDTNVNDDGCYEVCKSETCLFERMLLQKEIDRLENKVINFERKIDNGMRNDNLNQKETDISVDEIQNKMKGAEFQIEKDWEIIEQQSLQLDNLHQQFIEQRNLNLSSQINLQSAETTIKHQREEIKKFELLSENQKEIFRVKERSLEVLLNEKEKAIENLQSTIATLEENLACSQTQIEHILKESTEHKQIEKEPEVILKNKNDCVENLTLEIKVLKNKLDEKESAIGFQETSYEGNKSSLTYGSLMELSKSCDLQVIRKHLDCLAGDHKLLKDEFLLSQEMLKHGFDVLKDTLKLVLNHLPNDDLDSETFNMLVFELTLILKNCPVLSKDKNLFSLQATTNNYENKKSFRQIRRENTNLLKTNKELIKKLETIEQKLQTQEEVHRLQVDTIIDSLAKRCNVTHPLIKKPIAPSIHLTTVAEKQNSQHFLQCCLSQIEKEHVL